MKTKAEALILIKAIFNRSKKLEADIQEAAITAIYYSVAHGDVSIGQKLLEVIRNGIRKDTLVRFLENHGQFQWSKEAKTCVYRKNPELSKYLENKEESEEYCAGIKQHWTAAKPPKPIESKWDAMTAVFKLFDRMEKEVAADNAIHGEIYDLYSEFIEKVKALDQVVEEDEDEEEVEEIVTSATVPEFLKVA